MSIPTEPARQPLACLPTPVVELLRFRSLIELSGEKNCPQIFVKRDDYTGCDISGNKIRKLEYLLGDALARNATCVITCGAVQSNHCRATAVAARRLGLSVHLVLRGEAPEPATGNFLISTLVGASVEFVSPDDYREKRQEIMMAAEERLRTKESHRVVIIPEGGSNALGCWGYIHMLSEIDPDAYTHIVVSVGSGGTLAGLLLGRAIHQGKYKITGVNVCDSPEFFRKRVGEIVDDFNSTFACNLDVGEYECAGGYEGPGYGQTYKEEMSCVRQLASTEGIILDHVYTGKAFYGLRDMIRRNKFQSTDRVLFIHTGGIFELFGAEKNYV